MPSYAQYNMFRANVYMCYEYVHLDTLADISAYQTVVKPQRQQCKCKPRKRHRLKSFILPVLRKPLYVYDSVNAVNSIFIRTVKLRKL